MWFFRKIQAWQGRKDFKVVRPWSLRMGQFFDRWYFTANWMTTLGFVFSLPSAWFFARGRLVLGTLFMVLSLLTDWWDGSIARYQEETYRKANGLSEISLEEESLLSWFDRFNFHGTTHFGRSLDPFVDKVRIFLFLFTFGYGVVDHRIIWSMFAVGVLLTVARPVKRLCRLDHGGSNRFGKYKIFAEIGGMAVIAFLFPWKTWEFYLPLANTLFLFALVLGLASLFGHFVTAYLTHRRKIREKRASALLARESTRP